MGKRVGHKRKQPYESRQHRQEKASAYDKLRDDLTDFPPEDSREDEERARWFGVEEDE